MAKNQPSRSLSEWFELITQCRQSGLSDTEWCIANGISRSTFSKAAARLREKEFALPERNHVKDLDFTSKQEVVQINISGENVPRPVSPSLRETSLYLDNSHTIEISMGNTNIKFRNDADPMLVKVILSSLYGGNGYAC